MSETPNPLDVLREWITVTKRQTSRVKLTRTVAAFEAEAALSQVGTLVDAVDELRLWEPGRKGYAAALDRVFDAHRPFAAHKDTNHA